MGSDRIGGRIPAARLQAAGADPRRGSARHFFVRQVGSSACGACARPAGDTIHKRPERAA